MHKYDADFQVFILIMHVRVNFHKSRWTYLGVRDLIYKRACMHIQQRAMFIGTDEYLKYSKASL